MSSNSDLLGNFIKQAPPGELNDVIKDIESLTSSDPSLLKAQKPALKKYNEEQFTTVKLPGGSQESLVTPFNSLPEDQYYDIDANTSFEFDHFTRKVTSPRSYTPDSTHLDLIRSLSKAYRTHASEHFPSFALGVFPSPSSSGDLQIVLAASKYSPSNFWNGRWRSSYTFSPSSGSLRGEIKVDVHYFEDGNVRMLTDKKVDAHLSGGAGAAEIMREIGKVEKKYQEDLNRAFSALSEGAFKGLRRQLPVTRQKVEWDKIGGYRLGQDIGGGRSNGR